MFLKQYNYKPRTASQGSATNEAAVDTSNTASQQEPAQTSNRRRSSAGIADKFAGLEAHKRTGQDANTAARKASFAEQKPGGSGILGGMWQSFTKGT